MKKAIILFSLLAITAFLSIYVGCGPAKPDTVASSSRLPTNVLQSCTISTDSFNTWFASGQASENGLVLPANSVTFGHHNNCDFYQWSWQMFAWMTSPASGSYGSSGTVMESPVFYTASAPDSIGDRELIPHKSGEPLRVFISPIEQNGPNKLPMILDTKGNLLEVVPQEKNVKPMLLEGTRRVAISSVDIDAAGKPVFKDAAGKIIQNPKALITLKGNKKRMVEEFVTNRGQSVFLNTDGQVVETEVGQATHNGLISRKGSLVYYISMVNDVYAYYLSAAKEGQISGAEFPTTAQQRDSICAIARINGATLPDSNALAIEIKTSWVEAATVPDPENYIVVDAWVPTYNKTDTLWTPSGEKKVKLAMLGMHVVGSTAGHPEMVWSTFEHNQNAPNAAYQYLDSNNVVVTQPADSGGQWTLSSNASDPHPNVAHITVPKNTNNLKAIAPYGITASNSSLVYPWGSEANVSPNAENGSSAASNSEVISINNSVLSKLVGNDIRKNYILIGSTWTSGGSAPTGQSYSTNPTSPGVAIGTSLVANSTMETYLQLNYTTCFYCHSNGDTLNPSLLPGDLSHVYTGLQVLKSFKTAPGNK